jgi:HD-like signal output (HDOD) protein
MSLLGVKNIKNIVISLSTKALFEKGKIKLIDQKIWEHSVASAIFSRILALKIKKTLAEEAFLLGLLHSIGQVILSKNTSNYEDVVATAYNDNINILDLEEDVYGFNNYQLGTLVMEKWNMPNLYSDVIKNLNTPSNSSNEVLTSIVALADILAIEKDIYITNFIDENLKNTTYKTLGISDNDIDELNELFDIIYSSEKELFKL